MATCGTGSPVEMENAKTVVTLNTKGFCPFCLKRSYNTTNSSKITDEDGNSVEKKVDTERLKAERRLRQQFSKVIPRYLGANFAFMTAHKNVEVNYKDDKDGLLNTKFQAAAQVDVGCICIDCSIMVEKLCRLFHEWKKLEMELDWTARQLKNIMAFAKRAPSRKKVFKEQFSNSGTQADMEALEQILMFRKEILDKCSSKFRRLQPRVVFKRKGDPISSNSRRRSAKRKLHSPTVHDVEVQTETISTVCSSTPILESGPDCLNANSQCTPSKTKKRPVDKTNHSDHDSEDADVASPAPPSPAYSSDVIPDETGEEPRPYLRIRNIESLASPTKSVGTEESPVRKTRSSSRIPASNPVKSPFPKIVDVAATQPTASKRTRTSDKRNEAGVLERVPDLVASSSSVSVSNNFPVAQITRKATLTEWLQSTYNCDRCNKMFISEATLSVHKTNCGVVEKTRPEVQEDEEEEPYEHDDDGGESPMDVDTNNDDSSDEEEDPLGEQETDLPQECDDTTAPQESETTTKTCTYEIRILKKDALQSTQSTNAVGSRYCKYCKTSLSRNHFTRHRQTLKHKLNKRAHKKAKKIAKEVGGATENGDGRSLNVAETNGVASSSNNASTAPSVSSTAVVTVTQDENNVRVVKIIYVNKDSDKTIENQEKEDQDGSKGQSKDGGNAGGDVTKGQSVPNAVDVIDISDD